MEHGSTVMRAYICPGCYDLVELEQSWGHARTPRCVRCRLLMLSLRVFAGLRPKGRAERRVVASLRAE